MRDALPGQHQSLGQLPLFSDAPHTPTDGRALERERLPESLVEAAEQYCRYLVRLQRARHTVQSTALDLAGLVEHLGNAKLDSIQPEQLQAHVRWLQTGRSNHSASIRRKIASLKGLFRYAQGSGWIDTDPATPLVYPPPLKPSVIALRPQEETAVVAAAEHDPVWSGTILLMLDCGLKRDEVLALRTSDLLIGRTATVSQLTVRHAAQAKRVRVRSLPLSDRLHAALVQLLSVAPRDEHLIDLSVRGVNFVVETVGRRAGIERLPKLTPEILRDTFAVRRAREFLTIENHQTVAGASTKELQRLRAQHDRSLLADLGLSQHSDMAGRYRAAAHDDGPGSYPTLRDPTASHGDRA